MDKIRTIARREFFEVLRTRMYWVSTGLPVLIMVALIFWEGRRAGSLVAQNAQALRGLGAFMYFFVMFMSIIGTSQMLVTSVIEEKNSRVIEVLLSAVSPFELMAGKILGLVAAGLTSAVILVTAVGVAAGSVGVLKAPSAALLVLFLIYYLLGFALVSSLFAAVGAAFNTLKEAQAVLMPLQLFLILPFMFWMTIFQHPDGALAVTLSMFPPTAPTVMILRIAVLPKPPWTDIGASLLLLCASVPCAVWAAAKVFRTGILLYGKPPKLAEILRWIRAG